MSVVIDIDMWADIKWCQCKNVSDVSRLVTCVSGVCQLWGNLPTDRKTTYPAKSLWAFAFIILINNTITNHSLVECRKQKRVLDSSDTKILFAS
jgi:hypothetical protein